MLLFLCVVIPFNRAISHLFKTVLMLHLWQISNVNQFNSFGQLCIIFVHFQKNFPLSVFFFILILEAEKNYHNQFFIFLSVSRR